MTENSYRVTSAAEGDLAGLKDEWRSLMASCGEAPVFLDPEWIDIWLAHYRGHARVRILLARDACGGLAGVAPLLIDRCWLGPLPVRRLRFIGSGDVCPAHLDAIARAGEEEEVAGALAAHLMSEGRDWDLADFQHLAGGSRLDATLGEACRRRVEAMPSCCPFLLLSPNWDTFLARVDKKLRRNLRYFENLIEREHPGGLAVQQVMESTAVEEAIRIIVEMSAATRGYTSFGEPRLQAFHRDVSRLAAERGWLRLFKLSIDGHSAALLYSFRYGGAIYAYQAAHDPEWNRYSPGRLLFAHALRAAIEEGAERFDFLEGDQDYKHEWPSETRLDTRLVLSGTRVGSAYLTWVAQKDRVRQFARQHVPKKAKMALERIISTARLRMGAARMAEARH